MNNSEERRNAMDAISRKMKSIIFYPALEVPPFSASMEYNLIIMQEAVEQGRTYIDSL
jgi:hypothetical protein